MRRTAVIVGVLFWISNLATLVGNGVAGTIPKSTVALTGFYPHATQVVAGTLIAHINDAAIIGYAVLMLPVLKRYAPGAALGYVAFKLVEAIVLVVSGAALLSLIPLSQDYLGSAGSHAADLRAMADMSLALQFWTARLATFAYLAATPLLCFALYQSRLVPRFIPVWGFAALAMLSSGLGLGVGDPTRGLQPAQVLVVPIILWELTFATWLIVRGFQQPSRVSAGDAREVAAPISLAAAGAAR